MRTRAWWLLAAFTIALGGASIPAQAQTKWTDGVLTDEAGVPLFVSDRERPNESQCSGACLNLWKPYTASPGTQASGDLALVQRADGSLQWSYKGRLLYKWFNDEKPMDGQGMAAGNWHVLKQP